MSGTRRGGTASSFCVRQADGRGTAFAQTVQTVKIKLLHRVTSAAALERLSMF